jgi:hypothetical protein
MSKKIDVILENLKNVNVQELEKKLQIVGARFQPNYVRVKKPVAGGVHGVEETIDAVAVILYLVRAFVQGGITNYLAALLALPEAIIGIGDVDDELGELDDEDIEKIIAFVIANFPTLPTEKAQLIVEHSIKAMFHIYSVIQIVVENTEEPNKLVNEVGKDLGKPKDPNG